ncbi:MAG: transposase, partial [Selenomonadaceae bacterium]|nr:transposase [Selenomonadaceae bacterium]
HFGKPQFKSRKNRQSYSTNNQKGSVRIEEGRIKLPKVGWVKVVQHREIEAKSTIKTVTISKTPSSEYFVSILVEYEKQVLQVIPRNVVGLDYSMKELYVSSEVEIPEYPHYNCICIEELNMKAISKALKFGKSVHDNGWGMFTRMLEYKCEWYGKTLVKIEKYEPTSQKCHCCGYKNPETKDMSVRFLVGQASQLSLADTVQENAEASAN